MKNLQVNLGIARSSGNPHLSKNLSLGGGSFTLSSETKKMVFERDNYTCACCGFRSEKYQEIHYLDSNSKNLDLQNLQTVCIFCHQCFNLEQATSMRSGVLVWLPEISQTDFHHIMRAVYVARISQGPMAEAARVTLDALMGRREEARRRIQTDDPYVLSVVLKDFLTAKYYAERSEKLSGIRLLPLDRRLIKEADLEFNQFPQILAYWRSKDGPFGDRPPSLWSNLFKKTLKSLS